MPTMVALTADTSTDVLDVETRRFGRLLHSAGAVVAALCGVIGFTYIYAPTESSIMQRAASIEELNLSVQNAPAVRSEHEKLVERLEDLQRSTATLKQRVPQDANAGTFLRDVSTTARNEELAISNFRPEKPVDREGFTEMEVTLTGKGSYKSICTFFDRLAGLSRLSKVQDLSVSTEETEDQLSMTATLIIYFGLRSSDKPAS